MSEPNQEPGSLLPQRYQSSISAVDVRPRYPRIDEDAALSLETYLRILARRKWLLLAVAFTVLILSALHVFTITPMYQATVTLQVDPEDSKVLPYEEFAQGDGRLGRGRDYLWTQTEKLKTRGLASRVVERLHLGEHPGFNQPTRQGFLLDLTSTLKGAPGKILDRIAGREQEARATETGDRTEQLADQLLGALEVRPLRYTWLINVSYRSPDPELASQVCNTLAEEFVEQHLESKFEATTRATEFLRKQLDELKVRVEASEERLLKYAQIKDIVNLSDREPINRKKLADLSDELTEAKSELIVQTARYQAVKEADPDAFPEILKTPRIRELESRLSEVEGDLAGLSGRYGPEWPAVKELRQRFGEIDRQLKLEKNLAADSAAAEYRLAEARYQSLAALVDEQRRIVDRLNEDSIQYKILKRDADSNKELYDGLLRRLKEAGVAAGLRSSNIRIADQATVPRGASSPQKGKGLMLGLVLGLLLGIGTVFLAEAIDNTLKTTEDVTEQLGLPSLGVVPSLAANGNGHGKLADLWRGKFGKREQPSPILLFEGPEALQGRAWEAYRSVRTSLLLSHSGKAPQVIVVTSALPSEGKTTTAANTAVAMAQTGARTLIIDLDMRKPKLAETFGLSKDLGMSTYLSGNSELSSQIQVTRMPNLFLLSAGPRAPNPPELIGSPRMAAGLKLLREYFAYIVIDTPPALELSDALILSARGVDGVILVARGGKTPRQALRKASDNMIRAGAQILGVLLNDLDVRRGEYGYYHDGYYDSYYSSPDKALSSGTKRRRNRLKPD